MRRYLRHILAVACLAISCLPVSAFDFSAVDRLLDSPSGYSACRKELETMLGKASAPSDKADVLWRLARVQVLVGMNESTKEDRRAAYAAGVEYASKAVEADPTKPECHMWHCAATGRECQTHPLIEQASAVPVMMNDLTVILDKLGRKDFSEAWHALAEIYYNHPFKSTDSAVNFVRQAVRTIPEGECRLCTCCLLAKILMERDWSAEKRSSMASRNASRAAKATGNIEKYSYMDGMLGSSWKCPWGGKAYGSISDREEAAGLLSYAERRYKSLQSPSSVDRKDYALLTELKSKLK